MKLLPLLLFTSCALAAQVGPATAALDFYRLDRIGVVQYSDAGPGRVRFTRGTLRLDGSIQWRAAFERDRPANTPDWALGRPLIALEAWRAYRDLGFGATANFTLPEGAVTFAIGDEFYHFIGVDPAARYADGRLINVSTRARLGTDGSPVIAGFVIEERSRRVLIRAVGPGLAAFNVPNPAPDPFLSVQRRGQTLQFSNDWSTQPDAAEIRNAALRVGAFALPEGGRDAAVLTELSAGAYTVAVERAASDLPGGEILVEVYSVPADED